MVHFHHKKQVLQVSVTYLISKVCIQVWHNDSVVYYNAIQFLFIKCKSYPQEHPQHTKGAKALLLGVQVHDLNNEAVQWSVDDHMPVRNKTNSSIFLSLILHDLHDM